MKMRLLALLALLFLAFGPPPQKPANVPGTLLLIGPRAPQSPPPALTGAAVYHPRTGLYEPLVDDAVDFVPTADGRDVLFVQDFPNGAERHLAIVSVAADTLQQRWRYDAVSFPGGQRPDEDGRWLRLTTAADRVYVAIHRAPADRAITIAAIDRADGTERARWDVDLGTRVWGVDLHVVMDGTLLLMLAHPDGPAAQTLYRFQLPDGQLLGAPSPIRNDPSFGDGWAQRLTVKGDALYGIAETPPGRPVAVSFLDITTASVEQVELPFAAARSELLPIEDGASPDGRRLYVYAPTLGQVAVVDLLARSVERVATLDANAFEPSLLDRALSGLGSLVVSEADAKTPFFGHVQLSPDSRWLYAVGMTAPRNDFRVEGVLAIDTQTWQVRSRWLQDVEVSDMFLSADGASLLVQDLPWSDSRSAGAIHVLDTASGAELNVSSALPFVQLRSVPAMYQVLFGRAPSVQPAPALPQPTTVLLAEVTPTRLIADQPTQLEVRFVEPQSGLAPDAMSFEEPSWVTAHVVRADADIATELQRAELGIYRGTFTLPPPKSGSNGAWSVQAVAQWPDGHRSRVELREALFVRPSFIGSDGHVYVLDVTTEPAKLRMNEDGQVRAAFVDAVSGAALPQEVELDLTLPERLELDFFGTGSSSRWLDVIGHGVYSGQVRLWTGGDWRVWAAIPREGVTDTLLVGSVSVQP